MCRCLLQAHTLCTCRVIVIACRGQKDDVDFPLGNDLLECFWGSLKAFPLTLPRMISSTRRESSAPLCSITPSLSLRMGRIDPVYLFWRLHRLDIEVDDDGLLATAHNN